MASPSDTIKKMFEAHVHKDEGAFRRAAEELIASERRRNHVLYAEELERLIGVHPRARAGRVDSISSEFNGAVPRDKDRGIPLVDVLRPQRTLDELVLAPSVRGALQRVLVERRRAEEIRSFGLRPISRVLFCGPPGCGKTAAAECLAEALYLPLVLVRLDAVVSSYLGETAANLRRVFDFAMQQPMVLFLDEFDAVAKERAAEDEHGELKRVVTSLLQMLDGYEGEALTIAASNHQSLLDEALWRRFDDVVAFQRPTATAMEQLLRLRLRSIQFGNINLKETVKRMAGFAHADVEKVANFALKTAILDDRRELQQRDLESAVSRQRAVDRITSSPSRTRRERRVRSGEEE